MTPEALAARHPRLYHLTAPDAWPLIRTHGLLPAAELVRRAGADAEALTRTRRPKGVPLMADFGHVEINDNIPLSMTALENCLMDGITPAQWCAMLAERVFFWTSEAHMHRLRDARSNRNRPRLGLVIDTLSFAQAHRDRIEFSPINSGSTGQTRTPRGHHTYAPMRAFNTLRDWRDQRRRMGLVRSLDSIREVVVPGGVADIASYVVDTQLLVPDYA